MKYPIIQQKVVASYPYKSIFANNCLEGIVWAATPSHHLQWVLAILPDDFPIQLCQQLIEVLFTNEAKFTRSAIENFCNLLMLSDENFMTLHRTVNISFL